MPEFEDLLVNGYAYPSISADTLGWWLPRLTWVSSFSYGFTVLSRNVPVRLAAGKYVIKPLICASVMGIAAFTVYKLLFVITSSNVVSLFAAIALAIVIYAVLLLATKTLEKEEILQLPAGDKLAALLKRFL